jgi:hypothetical protein
MSASRTSVGLKSILAVKMLALSTPVLLNISQQSGKRIMIEPLSSTVAITSSQPFWDGSAFTPVKRSAEEVSCSIFLFPCAH